MVPFTSMRGRTTSNMIKLGPFSAISPITSQIQARIGYIATDYPWQPVVGYNLGTILFQGIVFVVKQMDFMYLMYFSIEKEIVGYGRVKLRIREKMKPYRLNQQVKLLYFFMTNISFKMVELNKKPSSFLFEYTRINFRSRVLIVNEYRFSIFLFLFQSNKLQQFQPQIAVHFYYNSL